MLARVVARPLLIGSVLFAACAPRSSSVTVLSPVVVEVPSAGAEVSSGTAAAPSSPSPAPTIAPATLPCSDGFADVGALCACLVRAGSELSRPMDSAPSCAPLAAPPPLGSPRLSVVVWGSSEEGMGERVYSLVARDSDGSRVVAELGRDFSPGAFGIFNEAELGAGAEVPLGPRTAHVVRSEVHNRDQNLAGLELCQEDVTYDTVCALGAASKPTRCVTVPVAISSGCGLGVVPDPNDAEALALIEERKANWAVESLSLGWSVAANGALVVTQTGGDGELRDASLLGVHPLF
jgi:hypothetical protein